MNHWEANQTDHPDACACAGCNRLRLANLSGPRPEERDSPPSSETRRVGRRPVGPLFPSRPSWERPASEDRRGRSPSVERGSSGRRTNNGLSVGEQLLIGAVAAVFVLIVVWFVLIA